MAALKQLGCEVANETERHVYICRGAVKMASVAKVMTTGKAQEAILATLEFETGEYYLAMRKALSEGKNEPAKK